MPDDLLASVREIKEILRIGSNDTLNNALRGEPPPAWTRRPHAKDTLRRKARELREQCLAYREEAQSAHLVRQGLYRETRLLKPQAEQAVRRGVIGSPTVFGAVCSGSSPDAGTSGLTY